MEVAFANMLWGLLALSIPLAIHLITSKSDKIIDWAAVQFLIDKNTKSKSKLQLNQIILLIIRLLCLIVLVLFLANLYFKNKSKETENTVIHIVENKKEVLENFKFELAQAKTSKQEIIYLDKYLNDLKSEKDLSNTDLQAILNKICKSHKNETCKIYINEPFDLIKYPNIYIKKPHQLFINPIEKSNKNLVLNINVNIKNKTQQHALETAIQTINQELNNEIKLENKEFNYSISDVSNNNAGLFINNSAQEIENIKPQKSIDFNVDNAIKTGLLPELLLKNIRQDILPEKPQNWNPNQAIKTQDTVFSVTKNDDNDYLLLLFLMLILIERWYSFNKSE